MDTTFEISEDTDHILYPESEIESKDKKMYLNIGTHENTRPDHILYPISEVESKDEKTDSNIKTHDNAKRTFQPRNRVEFKDKKQYRLTTASLEAFDKLLQQNGMRRDCTGNAAGVIEHRKKTKFKEPSPSGPTKAHTMDQEVNDRTGDGRIRSDETLTTKQDQAIHEQKFEIHHQMKVDTLENGNCSGPSGSRGSGIFSSAIITEELIDSVDDISAILLGSKSDDLLRLLKSMRDHLRDLPFKTESSLGKFDKIAMILGLCVVDGLRLFQEFHKVGQFLSVVARSILTHHNDLEIEISRVFPFFDLERLGEGIQCEPLQQWMLIAKSLLYINKLPSFMATVDFEEELQLAVTVGNTLAQDLGYDPELYRQVTEVLNQLSDLEQMHFTTDYGTCYHHESGQEETSCLPIEERKDFEKAIDDLTDELKGARRQLELERQRHQQDKQDWKSNLQKCQERGDNARADCANLIQEKRALEILMGQHMEECDNLRHEIQQERNRQSKLQKEMELTKIDMNKLQEAKQNSDRDLELTRDHLRRLEKERLELVQFGKGLAEQLEEEGHRFKELDHKYNLERKALREVIQTQMARNFELEGQISSQKAQLCQSREDQQILEIEIKGLRESKNDMQALLMRNPELEAQNLDQKEQLHQSCGNLKTLEMEIKPSERKEEGDPNASAESVELEQSSFAGDAEAGSESSDSQTQAEQSPLGEESLAQQLLKREKQLTMKKRELRGVRAACRKKVANSEAYAEGLRVQLVEAKNALERMQTGVVEQNLAECSNVSCGAQQQIAELKGYTIRLREELDKLKASNNHQPNRNQKTKTQMIPSGRRRPAELSSPENSGSDSGIDFTDSEPTVEMEAVQWPPGVIDSEKELDRQIDILEGWPNVRLEGKKLRRLLEAQRKRHRESMTEVVRESQKAIDELAASAGEATRQQLVEVLSRYKLARSDLLAQHNHILAKLFTETEALVKPKVRYRRKRVQKPEEDLIPTLCVPEMLTQLLSGDCANIVGSPDFPDEITIPVERTKEDGMSFEQLALSVKGTFKKEEMDQLEQERRHEGDFIAAGTASVRKRLQLLKAEVMIHNSRCELMEAHLKRDEIVQTNAELCKLERRRVESDARLRHQALQLYRAIKPTLACQDLGNALAGDQPQEVQTSNDQENMSVKSKSNQTMSAQVGPMVKPGEEPWRRIDSSPDPDLYWWLVTSQLGIRTVRLAGGWFLTALHSIWQIEEHLREVGGDRSITLVGGGFETVLDFDVLSFSAIEELDVVFFEIHVRLPVASDIIERFVSEEEYQLLGSCLLGYDSLRGRQLGMAEKHRREKYYLGEQLIKITNAFVSETWMELGDCGLVAKIGSGSCSGKFLGIHVAAQTGALYSIATVVTRDLILAVTSPKRVLVNAKTPWGDTFSPQIDELLEEGEHPEIAECQDNIHADDMLREIPVEHTSVLQTGRLLEGEEQLVDDGDLPLSPRGTSGNESDGDSDDYLGDTDMDSEGDGDGHEDLLVKARGWLALELSETHQGTEDCLLRFQLALSVASAAANQIAKLSEFQRKTTDACYRKGSEVRWKCEALKRENDRLVKENARLRLQVASNDECMRKQQDRMRMLNNNLLQRLKESEEKLRVEQKRIASREIAHRKEIKEERTSYEKLRLRLDAKDGILRKITEDLKALESASEGEMLQLGERMNVVSSHSISSTASQGESSHWVPSRSHAGANVDKVKGEDLSYCQLFGSLMKTSLSEEMRVLLKEHECGLKEIDKFHQLDLKALEKLKCELAEAEEKHEDAAKIRATINTLEKKLEKVPSQKLKLERRLRAGALALHGRLRLAGCQTFCECLERGMRTTHGQKNLAIAPQMGDAAGENGDQDLGSTDPQPDFYWWLATSEVSVRTTRLIEDWFMVYLHGYWKLMEDIKERGQSLEVTLGNGSSEVTLDMGSLMLIVVEDTDIAFFQVPKLLPSAEGIVDKFLSNEEFVTLKECLLYYNPPRGRRQGIAKKQIGTEYFYGERGIKLDVVIASTIQMQSGDCGLLAEIGSGPFKGRFAGVHVAGTTVLPTPVSYACVVTKELILGVIRLNARELDHIDRIILDEPCHCETLTEFGFLRTCGWRFQPASAWVFNDLSD